MSEERLVRVQEAEKIFGASRTTLWRWEKAGTIPKRHKIGGSNVWLRSEVDAWLANLKAKSAALPTSSSITPPENSKTSAVSVSAAVQTTSFLGRIGLSMPTWVRDQLRASIDQFGNLTYSTVAGGTVTCSEATATNHRSILITGGDSFSVVGNVESSHWNIVETMRDFLIACREADDEIRNEGNLILNKPTTVKRAIVFLQAKALTISLILKSDSLGDKSTRVLQGSFPSATDMRSLLPED